MAKGPAKPPKPPKPPGPDKPKPDGPKPDDKAIARESLFNAIEAEILRQELDEYNLMRALEKQFTIGSFDAWVDDVKVNHYDTIDGKKAIIKPLPGTRADKPKIKLVSTQLSVTKTSQTKRKRTK